MAGLTVCWYSGFIFSWSLLLSVLLIEIRNKHKTSQMQKSQVVYFMTQLDRFSLIFGSEVELEFLVYFLWLGGSVAFQCLWGWEELDQGYWLLCP